MPEFVPGFANAATFKRDSLNCRTAADAHSDRVVEQVDQYDDGSTGEAIGAAIGSLASGAAARRESFDRCMTSAGYARRGIRI